MSRSYATFPRPGSFLLVLALLERRERSIGEMDGRENEPRDQRRTREAARCQPGRLSEARRVRKLGRSRFQSALTGLFTIRCRVHFRRLTQLAVSELDRVAGHEGVSLRIEVAILVFSLPYPGGSGIRRVGRDTDAPHDQQRSDGRAASILPGALRLLAVEGIDERLPSNHSVRGADHRPVDCCGSAIRAVPFRRSRRQHTVQGS